MINKWKEGSISHGKSWRKKDKKTFDPITDCYLCLLKEEQASLKYFPNTMRIQRNYAEMYLYRICKDCDKETLE